MVRGCSLRLVTGAGALAAGLHLDAAVLALLRRYPDGPLEAEAMIFLLR